MDVEAQGLFDARGEGLEIVCGDGGRSEKRNGSGNEEAVG